MSPVDAFQPNGAAVLAFLESWEPDEDGFTDEIVAAIDNATGSQERDEERLAWVDELPGLTVELIE